MKTKGDDWKCPEDQAAYVDSEIELISQSDGLAAWTSGPKGTVSQDSKG